MPGQIQQAAIDYNTKLKLERLFQPNVRSAFARERRIYSDTILQTGFIPVRSQLTDMWDIVLQLHYQRTADAFLKGASSSLDTSGLEKELSTIAAKRMSDITVTSLNDMASSTSLAAQALQDESLEPSKTALARTGSNILRRKQAGRVTAITTTETQTPAETTKRSKSASEEKGKKVWITVRDSKVRASHIAVDGTELNIDEIFTVGGSKLRYPGDYAFNPNVLQVVNCRCACIYS